MNVKEITMRDVSIKFVPGEPGLSRSHIIILDDRGILTDLGARNIQRALGLPERGRGYVEVDLIFRRYERPRRAK